MGGAWDLARAAQSSPATKAAFSSPCPGVDVVRQSARSGPHGDPDNVAMRHFRGVNALVGLISPNGAFSISSPAIRSAEGGGARSMRALAEKAAA